ncbi:MAG: permease, partial [Candidatus Eremiobacteraeota bacterium]|nr:permease [Candidatus Eremiobacteraeota bacterium]
GYIVIVFILGGLRVWLFPPGLTIHASGLGAVALLAAIGSSFVIPTAGEIPIIQTLMHAGMGAGPATALLITLPAISLPSLFIVRKVFPRKLLLMVFACVFAVGVVAGVAAMLMSLHAV